MAYTYHNIVVGGTFDRLHAGHKAFLRRAFSLAAHVTVTITSDRYTAAYKPHVLPYNVREEQVKKFLDREKLLSRATIIPIDTGYGIAKEKNISLDAILVTDDTRAGATTVNKKRKEVGLPLLAIEVQERILDASGMPISSTQIRFTEHTLYMPKALRKTLHQPFGEVVQHRISELAGKKLIAVGDVTTRILHEQGAVPVLSVIDFLIERKKQDNSIEKLGLHGKEKIFYATNPHSTLTPELWRAITQALSLSSKGEKSVIIVDGEEDLAVLPLLLLAPMGYVICYGQPHVNMIAVSVTQETKEQVRALLSAFTLDNTRGY